MTAVGILVPVLTYLSGFVAFMAIVLLGFALIKMVGGK